jgi:hypothetical protein
MVDAQTIELRATTRETMRILITGATGVLGRRVVPLLTAAGTT